MSSNQECDVLMMLGDLYFTDRIDDDSFCGLTSKFQDQTDASKELAFLFKKGFIDPQTYCQLTRGFRASFACVPCAEQTADDPKAGGTVESSGGTWTTVASRTLPRPMAGGKKAGQNTGPTAGSNTGPQNPELFRTQWCNYGHKCKNKRCTFAHTYEQLRVHPRKNTQMCRWGENCTIEYCSFAHTYDELRVSDT
jgi:hypothetical protein